MGGTTKEHAARIRAEFKALGWLARDISVRCHGYSMGSSIYVTIKNPEIKLGPVTAIAETAEHIHRDAHGDILSGGNRYVHVEHSRECKTAKGAPYENKVGAVVGTLRSDGSARQIVAVTERVGIQLENAYRAQVWTDGRAGMNFDPSNTDGIRFAAFMVALAMETPARAS